MRKFFKVLIILFSILALIAVILVGLYYINDYRESIQAEEELIKCNKSNEITDKIEVSFSRFESKEIDSLKFQIKRKDKIFADTVVHKFKSISDDQTYRTIDIPFNKFLKTDTIVVTTLNNLKFYISGFQYVTSRNHGMFGPVGPYYCGLLQEYTINKKLTNGNISRDLAWLEAEKNKRIKFIDPSSGEYDNFSKSLKVTDSLAQQIFASKRINKQSAIMSYNGIEVLKDSTFYIFEEYRMDVKDKKYLIKINAATGSFKRYKNYPFN